YTSGTRIGHGQVEHAVAVKVPNRDRGRIDAHAETALASKGPVAEAQQHRDAIGVVVRHGQAEHAVPVEVPHRDPIGHADQPITAAENKGDRALRPSRRGKQQMAHAESYPNEYAPLIRDRHRFLPCDSYSLNPAFSSRRTPTAIVIAEHFQVLSRTFLFRMEPFTTSSPAVLSHLGSFVRQYRDGPRRRNVTDAET